MSQDDITRFQDLAQQWKKETAHASNISEKALHPACQEIIGMGKAAVPFILAELRREPDDWFWALHAITGAKPMPAESRGNLNKEMADAWLTWGMEHGCTGWRTITSPDRVCLLWTFSFPFKRGISMLPHDRIIVDPDILVGKPVVKGTRLSVDFLLGLLAQGWSEAEILRNYPGLQRDDLLACWAYASEVLREEKVYRYQVA